jgi:hypothetical protein
LKIFLDAEGDSREEIQVLKDALAVTELVFRARNYSLLPNHTLTSLLPFFEIANELRVQTAYSEIFFTNHSEAIARLLLRIRESLLSIPLLMILELAEDLMAVTRRLVENLYMLAHILGTGDSTGFFAEKYSKWSFESILDHFPMDIKDDIYHGLYSSLCVAVHSNSKMFERTLSESPLLSLEPVYERLREHAFPNSTYNPVATADVLLSLVNHVYRNFIKPQLYFYRPNLRLGYHGDFTHQQWRLIWQTMYASPKLFKKLVDPEISKDFLTKYKSMFVLKGIIKDDMSFGPRVIEEFERDIREMCIAYEVRDFAEFLSKPTLEELGYFETASDLKDAFPNLDPIDLPEPWPPPEWQAAHQ